VFLVVFFFRKFDRKSQNVSIRGVSIKGMSTVFSLGDFILYVINKCS